MEVPRRAVVAPAVVLALVLSGCAQTPAVPTPVACPAALLEGTLRAQGDTLAVAVEQRLEPVRWAGSPYAVRSDGGSLVLVDSSGEVVAREGDRVRIGGGELATGIWTPCGEFEVVPAAESS